MSRRVNIPIFIPHLGCPNDCVFCNQRTLAGVEEFAPESLDGIVCEVLSTVSADDIAEIAFFGGSFTGIGEDKMTQLLGRAQRYIDSGRVKSIRLSTRPDYINESILELLSRYSVSTIELGIQSTSDEVLAACRRGHTSLDSKRACELIKRHGFELVGQMMVGLPASDSESERRTAQDICDWGADAARIYPTVVFYGTELCNMAERREYAPLDTDSAVKRTADIIEVFDSYGVPCIRIGLCASENLASEGSVYGGANDAAIGEMAQSEVFLRKIRSSLKVKEVYEKTLCLTVPRGCTSRAVGHRGKNKDVLASEYGVKKIIVRECDELSRYEIKADITD